MIKQLAAIAAVSSCLAITSVRAAERNVCAATASTTEDKCSLSETVVLSINHAENVMRLDKPFKNVYIAAGTVADVEVLTDHRFILRALTFGETNIVFYDEDGIPIKSFDVIVKEDPSRVRVFNVKRPGQVMGQNVYTCTVEGCEWVSQTKLERPAENINVNGSGSPTVAITPRQ